MKWAKKFFLPLFCPTIRCKNIVADYRLEWVYESDQQKSIGIKRNLPKGQDSFNKKLSFNTFVNLIM